ncbi:hypothetical protein BJ987_003619 [Nocardia goodfellowii]|uniref:Uncharacterized protein n=1 Tax=Nocardia goodfellowii TaxID=882446 RepID=A0ABS4QHY5_9NOCA|nr:hypothetical protein [Nocardia goodfellowii]
MTCDVDRIEKPGRYIGPVDKCSIRHAGESGDTRKNSRNFLVARVTVCYAAETGRRNYPANPACP